MHAAVVEVTNKFKTQATAVFFPEPSRMDKHMRMYTKPGAHLSQNTIDLRLVHVATPLGYRQRACSRMSATPPGTHCTRILVNPAAQPVGTDSRMQRCLLLVGCIAGNQARVGCCVQASGTSCPSLRSNVLLWYTGTLRAPLHVTQIVYGAHCEFVDLV